MKINDKSNRLQSVDELIKSLHKRKLLHDIIYYSFYVWWNWLESRPRAIKSFWQRGRRGWADSDVWNFDEYLVDVLRDGLRYLQQDNSGIPSEIYTKYQDRTDLTCTEKDELSLKEWNSILKKIIEGFDSAHALLDFYGELDEDERIKLEKSRQRGFDLFKEYFFNLWS